MSGSLGHRVLPRLLSNLLRGTAQTWQSEHEIVEMRRLAWYTAGWLNFPIMLWDWVSLDETDMLRAIALLHDRNQISQEQRLEFENLIKLHARECDYVGWQNVVK